MLEWWRRRSLLLRLTLWHAAMVGVITLALGLVVYAVVEHRLHSIFDRDLDADLDFIEARLEPDGRHLRPTQEREVRGSGGVARPTAWFEVWSGDQQILLRQWPERRQGMADFLPPPRRGPLRAYTATPPDGMPVRVLERAPQVLQGDLLLRAYRDEFALYRTLRQLLFGFLVASPLAALMAALGGYLMARHALAPVGEMAEYARRISSESLSERLPRPNPHDELGQLAAVFNDTLERLERSFVALRRFTADASHELRTPLTALRAVGEVALRKQGVPPAAREPIGSMLEEAGKLDDILDALLMLARAETGNVPVAKEAVDVKALLGEIQASLGVLAAERGQRVLVKGDGNPRAHANEALLRQAVINLLHNAVRHGVPDATIELAWRGQGSRVTIEVADQGPGIAAEHQARIFERFFRIDKARSRAEGGAGLGLAITRLFVEQQGGRLELESAPGTGSRFRIVLAAAATA